MAGTEPNPFFHALQELGELRAYRSLSFVSLVLHTSPHVLQTLPAHPNILQIYLSHEASKDETLLGKSHF